MTIIKQNQQRRSFIETTYETYRKPLLRMIYKHVGNYNICEDILHEVFMRIINDYETLSSLPKMKLDAYIYLIARWVSMDYLRQLYKDKQLNIEDEVLLNTLISAKTVASSQYDSISKVELKILLNELSSEEQVLIIGKYYLHLSVDELVNIVGGTAGNVRTKLHRAKKRVFQAWTQSGLYMEDFFNEEFRN